MNKKKEQHKSPTYRQYMDLHGLCSEEVQKEDEEILSRQPRPERLCGEIVPKDLNGLSYGQLDDLRAIKDGDNVADRLCEIIFGRTLNLLDEDVNKVFGFANFCASELTKINKIFASIKPNYSSEEVAAGVNGLNFGSFGILDWYAKRMGITNQNEVRDVAWVRIFQCMKNDHEQMEYEKRLQKVYMSKSHASSHKK